MFGLNRNTESLTILFLPKEQCKNFQMDATASYWTLNAVLKKIPHLSIQANFLCSVWASHMHQNALWYLGRTPLTTPDFQVYSGNFYRELSLLLTMANLTLPDFVMWRVSNYSGLTQCSPPTALMSVLAAMASSNFPLKSSEPPTTNKPFVSTYQDPETMPTFPEQSSIDTTPMT